MDIISLGWAGVMTMFTFSLALVVWARLPDVLRWAVIQMVVDRVMTAEEIAYQIEMMGCTIEEFDEGVMIEIKWRSKS